MPTDTIYAEEIAGGIYSSRKNVPEISDIEKMLEIFTSLGSKHKWDKKKSTIEFDNSKISFKRLTKDDVGNMKGTSLLWGALLSRFGKAVENRPLNFPQNVFSLRFRKDSILIL